MHYYRVKTELCISLTEKLPLSCMRNFGKINPDFSTVTQHDPYITIRILPVMDFPAADIHKVESNQQPFLQ